MYRIDNATSTASLPTPAVPGPNPNSYFTKGVPGSIPATIVEQDWANAVQEELCGVIEAAGLTLNKASQAQLLAAIKLVAQGGAGSYTTSTTAANTYVATLTPAPAAYTAGMTVFIKFTNHNTGAATINLNGLGAKSIKDGSGAALVNSHIQDGMVAVMTYDGTNFQLINPYSTGASSSGIQNSTYNSATDTGTANTYAAILAPVPAYGAGLCCTIKILNTNTGASSLNLNSLGGVNIKTVGGNDPKAGMLLAGMEAQFFHDGTNFQLLNPSLATTIQNSLFTNVTDTGAANAYVATLVPALTAYVAGMRCIIKVANTNTGASTINISGLGTKNIKTLNGADPSAGMIFAGMEADLFYDGTNFQLMNAFNAVTQQNSSYIAATDGGSANAYTASLTPAVTAYATGLRCIIKITNTNTGASTLNLNSLGNKNIKTSDGLDPKAGMLLSGMEAQFFYDGTNMQLMNPYVASIIQTNSFIYAADTGSANTYVIAPSPAISAYAVGQRFWTLIANSNSGASTINVNGLGTKAITRRDISALQSNDMIAGQIVELFYDGTQFQLINYSTAGTAALTLIATNTLSGVANSNFTSIGSYKRYKLVLDNIISSATTNTCSLRFSTNNGSSFISTASYKQTGVGTTDAPAATSWGNTGGASIVLTKASDWHTGAFGISGELIIVNMNTASGNPTVTGTVFYSNVTPGNTLAAVGGGYPSINANALQIFCGSGNMTGTASLYGISQ